MIGSTIGSYRITGQLGEGGMGAVYRATDNIEREVAIKALHSHLTRDENRLQRFRAEAVALGRLQHPNIAALYHLLEQNGDYYMVMEFVEGQTLEDIVRARGALAPEMALQVFIEGLKGFEHAHARGVIHRDIKPSNLMVSSEGYTKITDFGIARMAGSGRMTQTGKVIGTLEYMSPEQVRGLEQDARSDIYSLGILLFELLTGRMPFSATSDYDIMRAHLEEIPPPARSFVATLPAGLDSIISKALAKDPAARFQSVAEMRQALEAVARELPAAPPAASLVALPTREVASPVAIPPTTQRPEMPPSGGPTNPVPNVNPVNSSPAPVINPTRQNQAPVQRPASPFKWAIPAAATLAGVMLLGGFWAWSAGRSGNQGGPSPEPAPTQLAVVSNQAVPDEPRSVSNPEVVPEVQATVAPLPDIELPKSLPAINDPAVPTPAPTTPPAPTAVPSPDKPRPRAVERDDEPSRPSVVPKPPAPRRRERVVTTPPRRTPRRTRVVERPRARPRVVSRPRPKPKPRVRQVVARRPPRVAPRPQRRRSSGGSSEEAALRSLIKGG